MTDAELISELHRYADEADITPEWSKTIRDAAARLEKLAEVLEAAEIMTSGGAWTMPSVAEFRALTDAIQRARQP